MSFGFGVTSWDEIFAVEELFASVRRQVAEFGWTWPSGEPPDWDAIQAGQLPDPYTEAIRIPAYPDATAIPTGMTAFSGPGMAFAAGYQWARLQFWDLDDWSSFHLLLPFVAPQQHADHGWQVVIPPGAAGLPREVRWSIWDGEQTSWMWQYALSEQTRQQVSAVITRDPWPNDEDMAEAHLWFLGFLPHVGRASLRTRHPAIL
jgi:hypothetical protein